MSRRGLALAVVLIFSCLSLSGCYYFEAKKEIKNAEATLEQLKSAGGPAKAPYEYCSAEAFLQVSRYEFGDNDFLHAKQFATRSVSAGQAGLAAVKK